jgi:hypothetical protein
MWTVSMVQLHQKACIGKWRKKKKIRWYPFYFSHVDAYMLWMITVCDEDATNELKVKTVKYFKGLTETHNKMISWIYNSYVTVIITLTIQFNSSLNWVTFNTFMQATALFTKE